MNVSHPANAFQVNPADEAGAEYCNLQSLHGNLFLAEMYNLTQKVV